MKYLIGFSIVVFFSLALADAPPGYYDSAEGLGGEELRSALHDIIDNHNSISYAEIWLAFYRTDDRPNGKVWDMYSNFEYTFGYDQGGSASGEGEGYNREHSWPTSWYGGSAPMYTDLFIVIPSDIYVNNRRSNYPYGEVTNPYWTSTNGSKLGYCVYPGYSGTVFEPIDEYKGDLARNYFYVTTRYYEEDNGWPGSPMTSGSQLLPWAEEMLMEWHMNDPVSTKEIDRNDEIYFYQNNR
nr:endonuclease [FCB group bacterium]